MRRTSGSAATGGGPVLAAVSACTVLVVGFVASINLAVPDLAASSLHPSSSQLVWIVDAYVVLFACLVIPAGALGDRLGRKGVLIAGLVTFGAGAAVSVVAPDVATMLVGRVICGIGAAAVLPNGLAVLVHATEPEDRPRAVAVWAAMSGAGGVVGNVGGGALLQIATWRWLFGAVVPLALLCAAWVAHIAPRSGHHNRPVDVRSAGLLTLATLTLLVGIVQGPDQGWSSPLVIASFLGSVVLFTGWTVTELRAPQPLIDPRLFRIPALRAACLGMLVVFFAMFGFFFLNASLLQYSRGWTVLQAGVGIVPMTIPLLVAARFVPRLLDGVSARTVMAAAFLIVATGLLGASSALHRSYAVYAGWLVVMGVGLTLALPTLTIAISAALPREQAGVAGGLQSTTREFGSALGVAVIGTLLDTGFAHRASATAGTSGHSLAAALASRPQPHGPVVAAYTAAAGTALRTVAVVALFTGALVVVEMSWARRRTLRSGHRRPTVTPGEAPAHPPECLTSRPGSH
ncbi:MFS transporter [Allobranchiibius huperziae]|uniref:MFS family permease n=1 Tax=Allobranchiibius huperziae TaxID=1874116 RepID=A0A853DB52_9MICO|nr:MFS transporter [Allobranchiibius huperziae]NYJ73827.1 MFS family permease [Allobranchiibius huperziae]